MTHEVRDTLQFVAVAVGDHEHQKPLKGAGVT